MLTANRAVVMGDINAKIGNDHSGYEDLNGKFGFGNRDRGQKMLKMCSKKKGNRKGNSWFKKSKQVTRCGYGEEVHESVIDYLCVGSDLKKCLIDVWVYPIVPVESDHWLLLGKLIELNEKKIYIYIYITEIRK
jgi:endonuclease/exonuclease/phosphatase family metal-dependent hydrolase